MLGFLIVPLRARPYTVGGVEKLLIAGGYSNREIADVHYLASRVMLYLLAFTAVSVIGFPLFWMLIC